MIPSNQHSPRFEKPIYDVGIKENLMAGTYVITVTAEDSDVNIGHSIHYSIASEDMLHYFTINNFTGL